MDESNKTVLRFGRYASLKTFRNPLNRLLRLELLEDRRLLAVTQSPSANFDGDLVVAGDNFLTWQTSYRSASYVDHTEGDADYDGDADADDLAIFKAQYGRTYTPVDLSITKSASETSLLSGQTVTYLITVTNNGATSAAGATVVDALPKELTDASWTAELLGEGNANLSGVGNIYETVDLAAGSSIEYIVTATVVDAVTPNQAAHRIATNAAHVCAPEGMIDTNQVDNSAIDADVFVADVVGGTGGYIAAETNTGMPAGSSEGYLLGDLNGDGLLDAVGGGSIWVNQGDGSFNRSASSPNGDVLALGDFDQDGHLDALIQNGSVLARWFNDGSGTLLPEVFSQSPPAVPGPILSSFVADLDGDGDLDAVVATDRTVYGLWNVESIPLQLVEISNADTYIGALLAGDFDGDGDVDVVLPNQILTNSGLGKFTSHPKDFGFADFRTYEVGDVDNDGDLDLTGIWYEDGNHASIGVFANDGSGNFTLTQPSLRAENFGVTDLSLGDLDDDGDLDAYVTIAGMYVGDFYQQLPDEVWLNDGQGRFSDSGQRIGNDISQQVALGDLDGDGDLDALIATDRNLNDDSDPVYWNADTDVSVDVDSSRASVSEGDAVTYTLTVTNHGPADAADVTVSDSFPAELQDVSWTAEIQGSGTASLSGVGDISESIDLTVGSSIVYTITADVIGSLTPHQSVQRLLSNSASIAAPLGLLESDLRNNRDSDADVIVLAASAGTAEFTSGSDTIDDDYERIDALGDLDGDGDLDAVIRTIDNFAAVVLNDGFGSFSSPIGFFESVDTVALGDMDGDGDLDLVFSGWPEGIAPVWLNDGSAQFTPLETFASSLSRANFALDINLADFNGDGTLDVLYSAAGQVSGLYLNDGSGSLSLVDQASQVLLGPTSLGDVDGDGDIDALSSYSIYGFLSSRIVTLYLNDGYGQLSASPQTFGTTRNEVAELGDLDGDGDLDVFVLSRSSTLPEGHRVWLNDGLGNFTDSGQALVFEGDYDPRSGSLRLGDLDGDRDLDAIIGSRQSFGSTVDQVWLNDGHGGFTFGSETTVSQSFTNYAKFALGDLDGDGDLDLIDRYARGGERVFYNGAPIDLAISLQNATAQAIEGSIVHYVMEVSNQSDVDVSGARVESDFDAGLLTDVRLNAVRSQGAVVSQLSLGPLSNTPFDIVDLPAGSSITYEISAMLADSLAPNQSLERFLTATARVIEPQPWEDINATNNFAVDSDLVVPAASTGATTFVRSQRLSTVLATGDIDGDRDLDVLVRGESGALILVNDGQGQFTWGAEMEILGQLLHANLGDLDGDGDLDALLLPTNAFARVLLNDGDGTFVDHREILIRTNSGAALGDIDGDGDLDVIAANPGFLTSRIWLNAGDAKFVQTSSFVPGTGAIQLGDVDSDGDLDVWRKDSIYYRDTIFLNDGRGMFPGDTASLPDIDFESVEFADIDADGDLDLVTSTGIVLENDGLGQFTDSGQTVGTFSIPVDLDADGDQDLLSRSELWLNDGSGTFFKHDRGAGTNPSVAGDFDSDGDLDVLGSSGYLWLNEPIAISAEFDQDADVDGYDFLAWQRGFGLPHPQASRSDGDADNDFDVDTDDLLVWLSQYGPGDAVELEPLAALEFGPVSLIDAALASRSLPLRHDSKSVDFADHPVDNVTELVPIEVGPHSDLPTTLEVERREDSDGADDSWLTEALLELVFG